MLSDTLRCCSDIEEQSMDPVTLLHYPSHLSKSEKDFVFVFKLQRIHSFSIDFLTPELVDIERWHSASSLRSLKQSALLKHQSEFIPNEDGNLLESKHQTSSCWEIFCQEDSSQLILSVTGRSSTDSKLCKIGEGSKFKVKEFQERCNIKLFKNGYELSVRKSQSHNGGKFEVAVEIVLG
ncbi:hypothetical protein Tco_0986098 [Tanacetum coccineum]